MFSVEIAKLAWNNGAASLSELCLTAGDPLLCVAAKQDKGGNLDASYRLIAATVETAPTFRVVSRRPLFDAGQFTFDNFHPSFAVSPDGRAFYFFRNRGFGPQGTAAGRLVLAEHWLTTLKEKAAR